MTLHVFFVELQWLYVPCLNLSLPFLDLGGLGIRDLARIADNDLLVLAGPAGRVTALIGGGSTEASNQADWFRLLRSDRKETGRISSTSRP
jgi:hypothetical protein